MKFHLPDVAHLVTTLLIRYVVRVIKGQTLTCRTSQMSMNNKFADDPDPYAIGSFDGSTRSSDVRQVGVCLLIPLAASRIQGVGAE